MRKSKTKKAVHIYNLLGKGLFACAIGILGLQLGGPLFSALGIIAGIFGADFLEKTVLKLIKNV